jgi:hypothetical protein
MLLLGSLLLSCSDTPSERGEADANGPNDGGSDLADARSIDARVELDANGLLDARASLDDAALARRVSERSACIAAVRAYCQRYAECFSSITAEACAAPYLANCPDLLFSPGATHSIEQVASCAERFPSIDCDEIDQKGQRACLLAGSLPVGAPCTYISQCDQTCTSYLGDKCGTCATFVSRDATCAPDTASLCPFSQQCGAGRCSDRTRRPNPRARAGEACDNLTIGCLRDLTCSSSDGGTRVCRPYPPVGQPCAEGHCAPGGYCDPRGMGCVPYLALGASCGDDSACGPRAYCDLTAPMARCTARPEVGAPCTRVCVDGAVCASSGSTSRCLRLRQTGESCGLPLDRCSDGSSCSDGLCKDTGLIGRHGALCAP